MYLSMPIGSLETYPTNPVAVPVSEGFAMTRSRNSTYQSSEKSGHELSAPQSNSSNGGYAKSWVVSFHATGLDGLPL